MYRKSGHDPTFNTKSLGYTITIRHGPAVLEIRGIRGMLGFYKFIEIYNNLTLL